MTQTFLFFTVRYPHLVLVASTRSSSIQIRISLNSWIKYNFIGMKNGNVAHHTANKTRLEAIFDRPKLKLGGTGVIKLLELWLKVI